MNKPARALHALAWLGCGMTLLTAIDAWADAPGSTAVVCRQGSVELIVGGRSQVDAVCDPASVRSGAHVDTRGPDLRVARAVQQDRDTDRVKILQLELKREELSLGAVSNSDPGSVEATRIRENIRALKRELAAAYRRTGTPSPPNAGVDRDAMAGH